MLGGGENSSPQSNLLGADRTWRCVIMTQRHQPTTPGTETIQTESSNHEQINGMVSALGGLADGAVNFCEGHSKTDAASNQRVTMGDLLVWGQFLNPNVNQDTIGKLSLRVFNWYNKNVVVPV